MPTRWTPTAPRTNGPMADDGARRREFQARAPELRAALVAELAACVDRAGGLSADEAAVLRHLLAYAGFSLEGSLFIPAFAVLWGEEPSYVPAVRLPEGRVRAAVATLRRRGVLAGAATQEGGAVVAADAVRALAAGTAAPRAETPAPAPEPAPAGPRRVVVYIAASVDGFIAKKNGDLGFLSAVETPGQDYGYAEFVNGVDAVIMGRKTHDKALSFGGAFPHAGRVCYVASRKKRGGDANAEFVRDPAKLIAKLKKAPGKDIFCDGGAELVNALLKKDLVDVLIVSLIPVLLGDGIPLFQGRRPEKKLRLAGVSSYPSGLVQLRYERT